MIALLLKVTVVIAIGLLVAAFPRRLASEQRHLVLLVTVVVALALPLGGLVTPHWSAPILPAQPTPAAPLYYSAAPRASDAALVSAGPLLLPTSNVPLVRVPAAGARRAALGGVAFAGILWALGTAMVLAWLAIGHWRLALITRHAWSARDAAWSSLLHGERALAGVDRPVDLFITPEVSTPLTWGVRSAVILLPEDALDWPEAHRSVVLRHELAHVARRDTLAQLVAGITCAVYWFHPLVWLAARQLRAECERACDDRVLATGTTGPDYATHLLTVARTARELGTPGFVALAMARPSRLEGRMRAILDSTKRRSTLTRTARRTAAVSAIVCALALSAFRPVPCAPRIARFEPLVVRASQPVVIPATLTTRPVLEQRRPLDTTFASTLPAKPGGRLTIRLMPSGGNVTIAGWDEPRIDVHGRLGGANGPELEVSLREVPGGAELIAKYLGREHSTSFSNEFEIKVPRRYDIDITSAGGAIIVNDVEGTVSGSTGGGDIKVNHSKGTMRLGTGGGEVTVTNSDLRGTVTTGGGQVSFDGVKGGLVGSSGSGSSASSSDDTDGERVSVAAGVGGGRGLGTGTGASVSAASGSNSITSIAGPRDKGSLAQFGRGGIQKSIAGGDIVLDSVPNGARIVTGGGSIRIGRSAGEVYLQTGGGSITVGPSTGSVVATTGAGSLDVTFVGRGPHTGDLSTGHGDAELTIPADMSGTLILETAYTINSRKTKIESEFPLTTSETQEWDDTEGTPRRYVRSKLVLGTGKGVITVRVVNGNVIVRKAGGGR
jgi:beta-lactamase regulating signal transducer with metallopeptidase domain